MALPATHTMIAEHPGKMDVTVAASGRELEADVQKKMKLWGVIEAFRDGRMPDNRQMDTALEFAVNHSPVELNKLSPEGRVIIDDARDILETLRSMVHEKNGDELFQNAVWSSYGGDGNVAKQSNVLPVHRGDVKADANQAAAHLRVLATLFVTNAEARKLLGDVGIIGRDVFATAATKAAEAARPDQDRLQRVDQEAPSNQWVGADGQRLGPNDTPELQMKGPDGAQIRYNPKDAPGNASITDPNGNTRSAGQAYDQAQEKKQQAQQQYQEKKGQAQEQTGGLGGLKEQARSHANDMASSRDPNASFSEQKEEMKNRASEKQGEAGVDPNQAQGQAQDAAQNAKGQARDKAHQLKERIPEEHRQRAVDAVQTSKDIVHDAFPEERREQFIYRLKKVVVECQGHKDYMEAMTWLLDTLENYQGHAQHIAHKGQQSAQALADHPQISDATSQFRLLIERFANGKSSDPIFDALDQIYSDSRKDPELRNYFTRLNQYAHRALLEQGWILEDESTEEANQLQEQGKRFFTDKYKGHQEALFDQIQLFFTAMADDPLNQRLGDDVKRLTKDLLFDTDGNLTFKPKLWNDIRHVILPSIISQIGYVPIPRCEYSDDKIDLVIENLVLSGPNLFPNVVLLEAHNSFTFSPYPMINRTLDVHHHRFRAGLSQIQADIRDVNFAFRRKSGWPKLSDHGLADVVIAGKGISVDIELESVERRRDSVFKVNHVNVEIDTMKFSIRDSKHDLLYKFVKTVATGTIKKAITVAVQAAIRAALKELDDQLVQVRNTADEAKRSDETTRREALSNMYARKKQTAQDAAAKADEKTGTFKIVMDRDSQLNPDLAHDSTKSTAKRLFKVQDLANSGNGWRSPAFDLLDPNHPAVTGRHHPDAVHGAGSGNVKTSAIAAARGETTHQTGSQGTQGGYGNAPLSGTHGTGAGYGTTGAAYGTGSGTTGAGYGTGTGAGYGNNTSAQGYAQEAHQHAQQAQQYASKAEDATRRY